MSKRLKTTAAYAPYQHAPLPVRLFNHLGHAGSARFPDAAQLLQRARRRTGLADAGDPFFQEPLQQLLHAAQQQAQLHPLGRAIFLGRLRALLENRLRIEALHRRHPEIAALPLPRPIVIAGLQRTGTTLLHRLIAADPRARALRGWEALHPAPLPGEGARGSHKRRALGRLAQAGLSQLAPSFFAIHPVESDAPEEDVLLLDHCFTSQSPEATLHVPRYARWLEQQDLTPSYRYLARILRLLQWQQPGQFWVLKTPHHMEYLQELIRVFPDAVIVQTHRDPQQTMASFCSMVAHGRAIFSDAVSPREIGRHWLRKVQRMLSRADEARQREPSRFIDVSYDDLLSDPIAQIRRIYRHANLPLSEDAVQAMQGSLARAPQHRYGRHVYASWDFGLSPAAIEEAFAGYRARFAIAREAPSQAALPSTASGVGHRSVLAASATALLDLRRPPGPLPPLDEAVQLRGRSYLVTGASSGLGRAIAIDLVKRGARVLGTCRTRPAEATQALRAQAGRDAIDLLQVDLADLDAVAALADQLRERGESLDGVVANAGLMAHRPTASRQGHELMFAVHYLANHLLFRRLLGDGVLPNRVFSGVASAAPRPPPRIVVVASETHRVDRALDPAQLGRVVDYPMADATLYYGRSKLALLAFASELSRRLVCDGRVDVAVHALCPGPVASGITRTAPAILRGILDAGMAQLFQPPTVAAAPACYLAAAPELEGETGWYLHRMQRKQPSPAAMDEASGRLIWEWGEDALRPWLRDYAA